MAAPYNGPGGIPSKAGLLDFHPGRRHDTSVEDFKFLP
jgi:hypothetical protein